MHELLLALMLFASAQTGIAMPERLPAVIQADPCTIEKLAWGDRADCTDDRRVVTAYSAGIVMLPDWFSPDRIIDQSFLAHELTHHLLRVAGVRAPCQGRVEAIAFGVQAGWLRKHGIAPEIVGLTPQFIARETACKVGT